MSTIFYTVLMQDGFPVRFISDGRVGNFPGTFADPGEASREFQCCYQPGACEYLDPAVFDARVGDYASVLEICGVKEDDDDPAHCPDDRGSEFSAILDGIRTDNSEFDEGIGNGYLLYYDRAEPHPEMACHAIYEYLTATTSGRSPEWQAGLLAGWFVAFGENRADFFWQSDPPPAQ